MSLFGAMFSGVSGISAQSNSMGMISDNISNVNTIGYKGNSAQFSTLVTRDTSTTKFSPGGVQSQTAQQISKQGLLQASSSATDIAVVGNGFFVVNEAANPGAGDAMMYTRAGSFEPDPNGNLVNTAGYHLMGWPTDSSGEPTVTNMSSLSSLETVNFAGIAGTAVATSSVELGANLPASDAIGTSHSLTTQTFDSLGIEHAVTYTFTKTGSGQWDIDAMPPSGGTQLTMTDSAGDPASASAHLEFGSMPADGDTIDILGTTFEFDSAGGVAAGNVQVDIAGLTTASQVVGALKSAIDGVPLAGNDRFAAAPATTNAPAALQITQSQAGAAIAVDASGTSSVPQSASGAFAVPALAAATPDISFTGDGLPSGFNVSNVDITMANGSNPLSIDLDLGSAGEPDGMTQFGDSAFTTYSIEQDGVRFGTFSSVSINESGIVTAQFDNGEARAIYKVPLGVFTNPNGLDPASGNAYRASEDSGQPLLTEPGTSDAGSVAASALEASNVDLAAEFTNMIITQRAYTASARIISTADEMLEEATRIAR